MLNEHGRMHNGLTLAMGAGALAQLMVLNYLDTQAVSDWNKLLAVAPGILVTVIVLAIHTAVLHHLEVREQGKNQ